MKTANLHIHRTLWGWSGPYEDAAREAFNAGFDGLEAPVPDTKRGIDELAEALANHQLDYIAEVTTAGSYVPDRKASIETHLASIERALPLAKELGARFVTCIGGCDAWPLEQSLRFFREAMKQAESHDIAICFETHRSRTLFNPWVTAEVARALPDIRFTFDFSHWCVVCERLMDSEQDVLLEIAPKAGHIHARVGYDQGPQVPHPAAPEYAGVLAAHQRWWEWLWKAMTDRGDQILTLTPEFGPDGYLQCQPFTQKPVADLWEINQWMAATERRHFAFWKRHAGPG